MGQYKTIKQAAKERKITTKALYLAMRQGRLEAKQAKSKSKDIVGDERRTRSSQWVVTEEELQRYIRSKGDRKYSKHEGELKFDPEKGEIDVKTAAKLAGAPPQNVYYNLRHGNIPHARKGSSYVIDKECLLAYYKRFPYTRPEI